MKYYLSSSDHVTGPYEKEELVDSFKYGMVSSDSMVCEEGADDWLPISILTEKKPKAEIIQAAPETPFTQLQETTAAPVRIDGQYHSTKSAGTAILLEVLPAIFLQTFGIGNIYAGNLTTGLILMFTYWALAIVNFILLFVIIGIVTWPITFVIYLVIAIISAQRAADRANWRIIMEGQKRL